MSLDILDELIELQSILPKEEDEFTVEDYRVRYTQKTGCEISPSSARRQLKRLVDDGMLTRRKAIHHGAVLWAFKPTSK